MNTIVGHRLRESGVCECCGNVTMCSSGLLRSGDTAVCEYLFRWTKDRIHDPWALFILADDRDACVGMTVEYRTREGSMMVVDPDRFAWPKDLAQRVTCFHGREAVINDAAAKKWLFYVFDSIFLNDPCIPKPA